MSSRDLNGFCENTHARHHGFVRKKREKTTFLRCVKCRSMPLSWNSWQILFAAHARVFSGVFYLSFFTWVV